MASARALVLATVFFVLPILLLLLTVLAFDANIFVLFIALAWLGIGLVFSAATIEA